MTVPGHDGHRPLAVFDIDGVLADVRHRLHHLQTRPQHWNAFFLAADRDPLLEEGAARLRAAQAKHDVVYLTGRPERNRALTRRWLAAHELPTEPLHMRPDDDYRPARWVKRETLRRLAAHPDDRLGARRRPGGRRGAGGRRVAGGAGHLAAALVDPAERPGAAGPDVTEGGTAGTDRARGDTEGA